MKKNDFENETIISVEEMREADAYTIANGTPGVELMYRAAYGVFESHDWTGKKVLIYCGSGNNGGDGYALAMILAEKGHSVKVIRVSEKLSADGGYYYEKCIEAGVPMVLMDDMPGENRNTDEMPSENRKAIKNAADDTEGHCSADASVNCAEKYDVIVDCILGTGFAGTPRGNARTAIQEINSKKVNSMRLDESIEEINSMRLDPSNGSTSTDNDPGSSPNETQTKPMIISVDINSGMNGNTGEAELAVKSDLTVSIGYLKTGFFCGRAEELIGELVNVDIGIKLPRRSQH